MPSSSSSSSSSVSARHQPDGTVDPGAAVAAAAAAVTTSRRQPQTQQPQPQRRYGHETTSVQSDESAGSSSSAFEPSSHSARYTSHVLDIDARDSNDQDNSADDLNFTYGYGGEDELEDDRSLASRRSMDTTEWFQNELSYIPEPKTPRTSTTNNTPGLEGFEVDALRTSTRSSVTSTSASSAKARHANIWQRPLPAHQVTVNQQVNLMDPRAAKYDEPLSPASSSSSSSGFLQSLYSYNSKTYPEQQRQQQGSNNDNNHQPSNNRFSFLLGSLLLSDDEDEDVYPTQKTTKRKNKKGRLRILVLFGCCLVLLFVVAILFKVLSANLSQNSNAVQEARGEISPPSQLNNIMPTMDTTFSHAYKSLETDSSTTAPKTTTTTVPPRPSQNAPNTKDSANRGSDSDSAGTNRSKKDENLDPSKHQNASTITTPPNMIHPTVMLPVSTRSRAIAAMILEYKVSSPDHLFQSLGNADTKPSASRRALKWICEDDPAQLPLPASYYRNDESDKDGQQDSSSTPTTSSMLLSDDAFLIHQVLQRYALAVLAFAMLPEEILAEDSKTTIASVGGNVEAAATATANNDAAQANQKGFQQSWLSGDHVCHWRGLDCGTHESRHAPGVERAGVESIHMTSVVSVNLTNHALTGTLPQEIFSSAAMPDLMAVDISHNQIHGGLPSLLDEENTDDGDASKDNKGRKKIKTSAGHYYVYFTHNDSSIHTVSSRSALRHLELSSNLLTGTIPTSFVSELQNLGNNAAWC